MPCRTAHLIAGLAGVMGISSVAYAGMPAPPTFMRLTDVAELRLQSISFFLVLLLVLALVTKIAWNSLRKEFPRLPRLSYF